MFAGSVTVGDSAKITSSGTAYTDPLRSSISVSGTARTFTEPECGDPPTAKRCPRRAFSALAMAVAVAWRIDRRTGEVAACARPSLIGAVV